MRIGHVPVFPFIIFRPKLGKKGTAPRPIAESDSLRLSSLRVLQETVGLSRAVIESLLDPVLPGAPINGQKKVESRMLSISQGLEVQA